MHGGLCSCFYDDAVTVYTAQKNRLGYSGVKKGLGSFSALAGMLTIRAFDNSQTMTAAMAQRGYDGNLPLFQRIPPGSIAIDRAAALCDCGNDCLGGPELICRRPDYQHI